MVWLSSLSVWSQTDGYNPANPPLPDFPQADTTTYRTLKVMSSPVAQNVLNTSGGRYKAGQSLYLCAYNSNGMTFQYWIDDEGTTVSTSRSIDYVMPDRDATLTAVFMYQPTNPSLPDFPEETTAYTLRLTAKPAGAGSFNADGVKLAAGAQTHIYAYTNSNFRFLYWADAKGDTVSTAQSFYFTMPAADTQLYAMYKYDPANPKNPGRNDYDSGTGEVIVDDFTPGNLSSAISEATGGNTSGITKIIVAGRINSNDFSIANNYSTCAIVDLSRTTGVTTVPSYCYNGNNHLSRLLLPASISRIEYRAFYNATALTELTCMSVVPPTLGNRVFEGVMKGLTVYVPASSVDIYETADGWKDYVADGTIIIMPVRNNVADLEVNLPDECRDGRYKNMTLELVNVKSGQKYRYVVTDRTNYTFSTLTSDTRYVAMLKNRQGAVLARTDTIRMEGENQSVSFKLADMKQLRTVTLKVMAGSKDVAQQCTVAWTAADGTFLAQGPSLDNQVSGTNVRCSVTLPQTVAMEYVLPKDTLYEVVEADNELAVTLDALPKMTLRGKVIDRTTQLGMSGITVTVSQTLNGMYSKAFTAKTDNGGNYTVEAFAAPTTVSYTSTDYVTVTNTLADSLTAQTVVTLDDVAMKPVTGAMIKTVFSYRESVAETVQPTVKDYYADYNNVAYAIRNETAQRDITKFSVQYPNIVLLEEAGEGDSITVVASSKNGAFMDITAGGRIGTDNTVTVSIPVVQLGGIQASFTTTENPKVIAVLYDAAGNFISKYNYASSSLRISDLKDGEYTLVTMGESDFFGSVYNVAQFGQAGLVNAVDYVANTVSVRSGIYTPAKNAVVPFFDESKFYYTGANTSFSVNKTSIVAGNYLTFTAKVDFKSVYRDNVSNVKLRVELPAGTQLVDNSIMVGSSIAFYEHTDNTVIIPLDNNTAADRVRFCVIPTVSGSFAPNATVAFTLKEKQMEQPIGSAQYKVQDIAINVPAETRTAELAITGVAPGSSTVEVYANENVVGTVRALANGYWKLETTLPSPYNLEEFNIYAKITSKTGVEMQTQTKQCVYNTDYVVAKTVDMSFYNGWLRRNITVQFDLEHSKVSDNSYMFYTGTDVTFAANLTTNDTAVVQGVTIRVYTDRNEWVNLAARYDKNIDRWVAKRRFESNNLPIGVKVDVDMLGRSRIDIREINAYVEALRNKYQDVADLAKKLEDINEDCAKTVAEGNDVGENLKKIIANFDGEVSTSDADGLIADFLSMAGLSVSGLYDDDLNSLPLNELLAKGDALIADNESYSPETIEKLLDETKALLNSESVLDWSQYFNSEDGTISFVDKNGVKRVFSRKLRADFDASAFSASETMKLPTTEDGIDITVYYNDDAVVVDNPKDAYVWTFESQEAKQLASELKRISATDAVAALHEACNLVQTTVNAMFEKVDELVKPIKAEIAALERQVTSLNTALDDLTAKSAAKAIQLKDVEKQIKALEYRMGNGSISSSSVEYEKCLAQKLKLESQRKNLLHNLESITEHKYKVQADIKRLKGGLLMRTALLGEVMGYYTLARQILNIASYGYNAIIDINRWTRFINSILPCDNDEANAQALVKYSEAEKMRFTQKYIAAVSLSSLSAVINGIMTFNPAAKGARFLIKSLVGVVSDFVNNVAGKIYSETRVQSKNSLKLRRSEKRKLKCTNAKDDDDDDDDDDDEPPYPTTTPIHDPSGFVYEGVQSNRLQGVTATCYYKETVEDMYGDLHENIVLWDAEEYAQKNPLFTDENGMYQWDVPQGLWQVKFEKEGYVTAKSEWLPVPPPQMDVNIGMVQNAQPEVIGARAYEDGVEIEFSKYMDIESLTADNIRLKVVKDNEESLITDAAIEMMNAEPAVEGSEVSYASKVRLATDRLGYYDEAYVIVSRNVSSYAGMSMAEDYEQKLDVEKKVCEIVADQTLNVAYGGETAVTVAAQPLEAAAGKKLLVASASEQIASADAAEVTFDANGQATFNVKGNLLGATALKLTLEDNGMEAVTMVNVVDPAMLVAVKAPRASRISGTAVYRGQTVALTTESEGATIYYTTDDSCPCDAATRIKYERPIVINGKTTIKAMAVGISDDESDVETYEYTIRQSDVKLALSKGWNWSSHDLAAPLPVSDLEDVATRILTQTRETVKDDRLGFVGSLESITADEAMKVVAADNAEKAFSGEQYNPMATAVRLHKGWNWLGYPVSTELTLTDALSLLDAEEDDCIETLDGGFATYSDGAWTGELKTLKPGHGYLYKSASDKSFVYNTVPTVTSAKAIYGHRLELNPAPCSADKHQYPNMMPVVARLECEGASVEGQFFVVAVSGGECRGVGKVEDGMAYLSVYGDGSESIGFVAVDAVTGDEYSVRETVAFTGDMLGTVKSPYVLHIGEATGIDAVEGERLATDAVYGINGIRVKDASQKGVYIMKAKDANGNAKMRKRVVR